MREEVDERGEGGLKRCSEMKINTNCKSVQSKSHVKIISKTSSIAVGLM
jgi:hypothetical protein